jgi:putative phosphoribosyl transferase
MVFRNRYDAAMQLIPYLEKYKDEEVIVFAVPRGGVPIGYYIAVRYGWPLELLLTKKLGHPQNEEVAVGAVGLDDYILDERFDLPVNFITSEIDRIRKSLAERQKKFMGDRKPAEVKGKVAIIVDDGIATGNTLLSAIQIMRKHSPKKIVLAAPVAPLDTSNKLNRFVEDFVCLLIPEVFYGVGQFYIDFTEVTDDEVLLLLTEANRIKSVL